MTTVGDVARDGSGGIEEYEGRLVQLHGVRVNTSSWNVSGSGTNYQLVQGADTVDIRVDNNVDFINTPAPQGLFDIVGVVSQFKTAPPLIGGYQVMPRSRSDIISTGPIIETSPEEHDITTTSVRISWETVYPGSSRLRYGITTAYELGVMGDTAAATYHSVVLSGLQPATIYNVQAFSVANAETSAAANLVVSTSSLSSTGTINVYFNKSIDASVQAYETAMGNVNLVNRLVTRIDSAIYSVDVCLYSLSGTPGPGDTVADALVRAKQRGVKIRAIGERDNNTTAPWKKLRDNGIPVIDDSYDAVNAGVGLMHNKFFVFDNRDNLSDTDDWVWTGSWNVTDQGTNLDFQNAIEIQDRALAGAFTREFNEMWGSETDQPSASASRFGARKTDNTPHRFNINGVPVGLYFSPSDRVTGRIVAAIGRAQYSVNFALLTFTRPEIAAALKSRHDAGVIVRGIFDNDTDAGSQFSYLQSNGMDVLVDPSTSAFLHHKYGIIDAENRLVPNYVITGSHNWSSSAENANNENTLIIEDRRVANLYLQEFKARYIASGGQGSITVSAETPGDLLPSSYELSTNFPNPFNPSTSFLLRLPARSTVRAAVYDLIGREVGVLAERELAAGVHALTWSAGSHPSGVYLCRVVTEGGTFLRKIVLLR